MKSHNRVNTIKRYAKTFLCSALSVFPSINPIGNLALADSAIEVYEDTPKLARFESDRFFDSSSAIEVSYLRGKKIVAGVSRAFLSKDVFVTIANPNFSGLENTKVVFMNVCTDRRSEEISYRDVFWAQLRWNGEAFESNKYTVTFDFSNSENSYACRQEIAAVSNGYWMRNKESGTNNYRYSMNESQ